MNSERQPWRRRTLTVIALAAVYRLLFIPFFPLGPDEASYWTWAQKLDLGYVDHPPLVAYAIRMMIALLGDHYYSSRLLAGALAAGSSWLLYRSGEELFDGRVGFWAAVLHATCPMFGMAGGIMLLPECLLAFCMCLALWLAARMLNNGDLRLFLPLGIVLGSALLSKYPGILVLLGLGLFALLSPRHRSWFGRWQPYAMTLIGLAMFAPVVAWNIRHAGAGLEFMSQRTAPPPASHAPLLLAQCLFTQAAYHSPITFLLLVYGVGVAGLRAWRVRDERALLLFCYSGPVIIAFLLVSTFRYTLPHWPAAGYLAAYIAAPAAALGFPRKTAPEKGGRSRSTWARLLPAAAVVGGAISLLLPISMVTPVTKSAPYLWLAQTFPELGKAPEPMAQAYGWDSSVRAHVAALVDQLRADGAASPVVMTHDHLQASLLMHGLQGVCPVISLGPRAWQFEVWYSDTDLAGKRIIYVSSEMSDSFRGNPQDHFRFDSCTAQPDLPILINGYVINTMHIWICDGYRGLN